MISIYKGQWDTSGKWHLSAITWGAYSSQWTIEWIWWLHFDQATEQLVSDLQKWDQCHKYYMEMLNAYNLQCNYPVFFKWENN